VSGGSVCEDSSLDTLFLAGQRAHRGAEFDLECYDAALATTLETVVLEKLEHAQLVTLADLDKRSLPVKLRDGMARLLTPYL
jgi:hypothetical protein